MDLWSMMWMTIQQYVNIPAVVIAVVVTQGIKYLLPSAPGDGKTAIEAGRWWTRLMPFIPIVIGMAACALLEWDAKFTPSDWTRGVMSGILSAYMYRTTQVTIFGK